MNTYKGKDPVFPTTNFASSVTFSLLVTDCLTNSFLPLFGKYFLQLNLPIQWTNCDLLKSLEPSVLTCFHRTFKFLLAGFVGGSKANCVIYLHNINCIYSLQYIIYNIKWRIIPSIYAYMFYNISLTNNKF